MSLNHVYALNIDLFDPLARFHFQWTIELVEPSKFQCIVGSLMRRHILRSRAIRCWNSLLVRFNARQNLKLIGCRHVLYIRFEVLWLIGFYNHQLVRVLVETLTFKNGKNICSSYTVVWCGETINFSFLSTLAYSQANNKDVILLCSLLKLRDFCASNEAIYPT